MARILVVDDEAGVRTILEHALKTAGYEVVVSENGRDGMKKHRAVPVDIAIIDLFMPDQDGIETITTFREQSPEVPIIAISGNDSSGAMLSMARQLGATRVLEKPFDGPTLLLMVQEVLSGR